MAGSTFFGSSHPGIIAFLPFLYVKSKLCGSQLGFIFPLWSCVKSDSIKKEGPFKIREMLFKNLCPSIITGSHKPSAGASCYIPKLKSEFYTVNCLNYLIITDLLICPPDKSVLTVRKFCLGCWRFIDAFLVSIHLFVIRNLHGVLLF